ncbi:MAG: flavin reductase family protein [Patiriisocius sp.]|uniref:flavin reductase family protein n=1 Tax=Patiriisocius sp. TaxID=2822396 RepID=UPI003EF229BC
MITIDPKQVSTGQLHGYMLGAVAPRPIAFASTVDANGNVNLSPFSFFNVFSANPPIMIFSPARRVRDNTVKHTLENVLEVKEVVINICNYAMVQQMSLASTEYAKGVNEFKKAGFTELASETVKPPRVAEAPVQFECKVNEVISLGNEGGAGNLVICEVLKVHVSEAILDSDGKIDPIKLDAVSRMGGNWYGRAKEGMFEVPKPLSTLGIGIDNLPDAVKNSSVFTGNDLAMLANIEALPENIVNGVETSEDAHEEAQQFLLLDAVEKAWQKLIKTK